MTEFCPGCYRKDAAMDFDEGTPPPPPGTKAVLIPTSSKAWQDLLDRQAEAHRLEMAKKARAQQGEQQEGA